MPQSQGSKYIDHIMRSLSPNPKHKIHCFYKDYLALHEHRGKTIFSRVITVTIFPCIALYLKDVTAKHWLLWLHDIQIPNQR